ncbi:MAG: hypothetical protein R2732_00360 [Microbacteriaceae bacterium]
MSNFERFSLTIARWLTHVYDEDNPAESSTNPGDVARHTLVRVRQLFVGWAKVRMLKLGRIFDSGICGARTTP